MKKIDVVLITVVSILVIIVGYGYFGNMVQQEHDDYCKNWFEMKEEQRKILENDTNSDWSEFNRDANEYNKECYY